MAYDHRAPVLRWYQPPHPLAFARSGRAGPGTDATRPPRARVLRDSGAIDALHAAVELPTTRGTVAVYDSRCPHQVTPLTRGVRRSLVAVFGNPPGP